MTNPRSCWRLRSAGYGGSPSATGGRTIVVARRSAVDQRADSIRQIKSLIVTAPEGLRTQLRGLSAAKLVKACAGLRPDPARVGSLSSFSCK